jgi:hypothetical protein
VPVKTQVFSCEQSANPRSKIFFITTNYLIIDKISLCFPVCTKSIHFNLGICLTVKIAGSICNSSGVSGVIVAAQDKVAFCADPKLIRGCGGLLVFNIYDGRRATPAGGRH